MKHYYIKQHLVLVCTLLLLACGASKKSTGSDQNSSDLGSRDPIVDGNNTNTQTTPVGFYALCNNFSEQDITGVVTNYINPVTNKPEQEIIRLELKNTPSALDDSDEFYVQIFRWSEESEGNVYVNSTATSLFFQYSDGSFLNEKPVDNLSKQTIEEVISNSSVQGLSLNNFFSKVVILLVGMDLQYDAIMINTYNTTLGNQALSSSDVLIPAFAADPNIYAETHPQSLLELHPNYSMRESGYTESQFYQETLGLCN